MTLDILEIVSSFISRKSLPKGMRRFRASRNSITRFVGKPALYGLCNLRFSLSECVPKFWRCVGNGLKYIRRTTTAFCFESPSVVRRTRFSRTDLFGLHPHFPRRSVTPWGHGVGGTAKSRATPKDFTRLDRPTLSVRLERDSLMKLLYNDAWIEAIQSVVLNISSVQRASHVLGMRRT